MKKILLLSLSLFALPVFAEDDKKKMNAAEELVEVMEFEQNIIEGGEAAFSMIAENLSAEDLNKEEMQEVKDAFLVYMAKLANDPALKARTIELYEKNFTNEELADLVVFYKTPLGKKTLSTLPAITGTGVTGAAYYTEPNGAGIQYNEGDVITSSIDLYLYVAAGACSDEESVSIEILLTPEIDPQTAVVECDTYSSHRTC